MNPRIDLARFLEYSVMVTSASDTKLQVNEVASDLPQVNCSFDNLVELPSLKCEAREWI
jgi:hypothetical protein